MEMGMDKAVDKPENYGLPFNWSADMMGMMTLLRVLPDETYEKILAMKTAGQRRPAEVAKPEHHHE